MKEIERDRLLTQISERQVAHMEILTEVRDEVKKTNGRVKDIEIWKAGHVESHNSLKKAVSDIGLHDKETGSFIDRVKGAWWVITIIGFFVGYAAKHFLA